MSVTETDLARTSLNGLRAGVIVLDAADRVALANPSAIGMALVRDDSSGLSHAVLRSLVAQVRRVGEPRDVELDLPRSGGRDPLGVRVRVAVLDGDHVHLEIEDVTEAHRLARVRRDFVANVSHELKTPVGALRLLSEALLEAVDSLPSVAPSDSVDATRRFTERIQHESARLARLVSELIELSRLQGAEPLPAREPVDVDRLINEVLDRSRIAAVAKGIVVRWEGVQDLTVYGHEGQLATALANLVENAVAYSPDKTNVVIRTQNSDEKVDISVVDQGIGIAHEDTDRIFERFYRADPARSRATGGTGLGLAIVKHIASNHGGKVDVTSELGTGSTFTLRLPSRPPGDTFVPKRPVQGDKDAKGRM